MAFTGRFLAYLDRQSRPFLWLAVLVSVLGYSELRAAMALTVIPVIALVIAPNSGRLNDRIGPRLPAAAGAACFAVGLALLAQLGGGTMWASMYAAYEDLSSHYQRLLDGLEVLHSTMRTPLIIDGRNLGQSIYSVGAQSASSTLWNFWMGN